MSIRKSKFKSNNVISSPKLTTIILTLILLLIFNIITPFTKVHSINLIPDPQNSIVEESPYQISKPKITLSFSFQTASTGIAYNQFFGVKFQKYDYAFTLDKTNNDGSLKFSCSLKDINNKVYKVKAVASEKSSLYASSTSESNIAYCQLVDTETTELSVGDDLIYYLTIEFDHTISTSYLTQIEMFTSTSNNENRIIIDMISSMGSIIRQETYNRAEYKLLNISKSSITTTSGTCSDGTCTDIYPYDEFTVNLQLLAKDSFSTINDCTIVIKLPYQSIDVSNINISTTSVTTGTSSTTSADLSELKSKTGKTLLLNNISQGMYAITNIGEDLVENREFIIQLKNIKALDTIINTSQNIEVIVYWKNSFSILSYDSTPIINIKQVKVFYNGNNASLTGISHPEYFDIYQNAAWPVKFVFSVNSNLNNGGYLLIQQTNTKENASKANFIASTCDFSENNDYNSGISNVLDSRPVCFPLTQDFASYDVSSSNNYKGSAIFFKMDKIETGKNYTFVVWLYADNCGSFSSTGVVPDPTSNNTNAYTNFEFTYTIYKDINQSKLNVEVFTDQIILAKSAAIQFNNKCYGTNLETGDKGFLDYYSQVTRYPGSTSTDLKDILLFKEIFDFSLGGVSESDLSCESCILTDVVNNEFPSKYIYSTLDETQIAESYFLLKAKVQAKPYTTSSVDSDSSNLNYYLAATYLPLPFYINNNDYGYLKGKLNVQFSSQLFTFGDDINNCYLSWANINDHTNNTRNNQISLLNYNNEEGFAELNNSNFVYSNSCNNGSLDSTSSNVFNRLINDPFTGLPSSKPKPFRITSFNNNVTSEGSSQQVKWSFLSDSILNSPGSFSENSNYEFFIFSTCVKTQNPSNINLKSIFTYIDIQIQWLVQPQSSSNYVADRVIRMIKLLPEGDIFNNWEKYNEFEPDPVKFHYAYVSDINQSNICLIDISGQSLSALLGGETTSIILFLNDITLLETDRTSLLTNYPMAPLISNIKTYAFSSAYTKSIRNQYTYSGDSTTLLDYMITNLTTSTKPKSFYHTIFGSMIIIDQVLGVNITSITSDQPRLIIPYYCPIQVVSLPLPNLLSSTHQSIFIGSTSLNGKNMSNINQFNRLLTDSTQYLKAFLSKTEKSSLTVSKIFSTLRFRAYNYSNERTDYLYVLNGTLKNEGVNLSCSGFSLFLNQSVKINYNNLYMNHLDTDNNNKLSQFTPNFYYSGYPFYIFGKKFNKALLYTSETQLKIYSNTSTTGSVVSFDSSKSSNIYFTGIERPDISAISTEGFNNLVGFSCASTNASENSSISNYIYSSTTVQANDIVNFYSFIVDYYPDDSAWTVVIEKDFNESLYTQDTASNVLLTLTLPINLPINSEIIVGSKNSSVGNFSDSTICAVKNPLDKIDTNCTLLKDSSNFNYVKCGLPDTFDMTTSNVISICCYNIKYTTVSEADFYITDLKALILSNEKYDGYLSKYVSSPDITETLSNGTTNYLYKNSFTYNFSSPLTELSSVLMNKIVYSHTTQHNSYGFIKMEILLPREPNKGMLLEINGDFTIFKIEGITPVCDAAFTNIENFNINNMNQNIIKKSDKYIDSCYFTASSSTFSTIKISTRNFIYKCSSSITLGKYLSISLGPVKEIDFSLGQYLGTTFELLMKDKTTGTVLTKSGATALVHTNSKLKDTPYVTDLNKTLCPITSIYPKIVDETATFTIVIDLTNASIAQSISSANSNGKVLNEISIFANNINLFILQFYSLSIYQLNNTTQEKEIVNFELTREEILNISLNYNSSDTNITLYISGVINKNMPENSVIACSLNYYDLGTKDRFSFITGTGLINDLPLHIAESSQLTGNLKIYNYSEEEQTRYELPRKTSSFKLKIAPDTTLNMVILPFIIKSNPVIILTFKYYYYMSFYEYTSSTNNITLQEYVKDSDNQIVLSETQPEIKDIDFIGNKVIIYLSNSEWTFTINIAYWELKLNNLKTPVDEVQSSNVGVLLTNFDYSTVFKLYNNFDSSSWNLLNNPEFDLLTYSRGRTYKYENKFSIIDVSTENDTYSNYITVSPGLFKDAYFIKRETSNTILLENNRTNISLNTNKGIATTDLESYEYYLFSNIKLPFKIAVKCATPNGTYLIDFNSSNPNYPLSLVFLNIVSSQIGQVKLYFDSNLEKQITSSINIPLGGFMYFYYQLSNTAYENLSLKWTSSLSTTTTSINTVNILSKDSQGITKLTSTATPAILTSEQIEKFTITQPNNCFEVVPNNLNVTFTGQINNITNIDFSKNFTQVESNLQDLNEFEFEFISRLSPLHLSCVIYCSSKVYSLDLSSLSEPLNYNNIDYLVKYYYYYYHNANEKIDFKFSNLLRGQDYKLTCNIDSVANENQNNYQLETGVYNLYSSDSKNGILSVEEINEEQCILIYDLNTENNTATNTFQVDDNFINLTISNLQSNVNDTLGDQSDCSIVIGPYNRTDFYINYVTAEDCSTKSTSTDNTENTNFVKTTTSNIGRMFKFCVYPFIACSYNPNTNLISKLLASYVSDQSNYYASDGINVIMEQVDSKVITIQSLQISEFTVSSYNKVSFHAEYPFTVSCNFSINLYSSSSTITRANVVNCDLETNYCGEFSTGREGSDVAIYLKNIRALTYYFWVFCHSYKEDYTYFSNVAYLTSFTTSIYDATADPESESYTG